MFVCSDLIKDKDKSLNETKYSYIYLFVYSFVHLFICSYVHLFVHLFID